MINMASKFYMPPKHALQLLFTLEYRLKCIGNTNHTVPSGKCLRCICRDIYKFKIPSLFYQPALPT